MIAVLEDPAFQNKALSCPNRLTWTEPGDTRGTGPEHTQGTLRVSLVAVVAVVHVVQVFAASLDIPVEVAACTSDSQASGYLFVSSRVHTISPIHRVRVLHILNGCSRLSSHRRSTFSFHLTFSISLRDRNLALKVNLNTTILYI